MRFCSNVPRFHIVQQLVVHVPQEGPVAPLLQVADGPVVLIADDRARRLRGEGRVGAVSWRCLHASRRSERDAEPASRRPCAGRTLRWPRCPAPPRVHGNRRGRLSEATFATSPRETLPPPGQPGGREAPLGTGARTSCDVPCVRPPQLPCLHRLGRRTPWCLPHGADRAGKGKGHATRLEMAITKKRGQEVVRRCETFRRARSGAGLCSTSPSRSP